jgi:hypothetical protein
MKFHFITFSDNAVGGGSARHLLEAVFVYTRIHLIIIYLCKLVQVPPRLSPRLSDLAANISMIWTSWKTVLLAVVKTVEVLPVLFFNCPLSLQE